MYRGSILTPLIATLAFKDVYVQKEMRDKQGKDNFEAPARIIEMLGIAGNVKVSNIDAVNQFIKRE